MDPNGKIIVALDMNSLEKAKPLVESLAPHVACFKVGLELITAVGSEPLVRFIHSAGSKVFYDGKFNDTPNTIRNATKIVANLNVKMFNVHASAGIEAMRAAVDNKGHSRVLAVTVLTSLEEDIGHMIFGSPIKAKVLQLARDAKLAGCDGIVCSPQELLFLRKHSEISGLIKITPGIRPKWADHGDQKRVMTPGEAIKAGSTAIVVGRPVTQPPMKVGTSVDAVRKIADEIANVL